MKIALGARELGEIREIFLAEVSPVVYFGRELTDPRGAPAHAAPTFPSPLLLGVYAGRRGSSTEEQEMSFGRVWHRRLLDEIFFARVKGGSPALADEGNTVATPDD